MYRLIYNKEKKQLCLSGLDLHHAALTYTKQTPIEFLTPPITKSPSSLIICGMWKHHYNMGNKHNIIQHGGSLVSTISENLAVNVCPIRYHMDLAKISLKSHINPNNVVNH